MKGTPPERGAVDPVQPSHGTILALINSVVSGEFFSITSVHISFFSLKQWTLPISLARLLLHKANPSLALSTAIKMIMLHYYRFPKKRQKKKSPKHPEEFLSRWPPISHQQFLFDLKEKKDSPKEQFMRQSYTIAKRLGKAPRLVGTMAPSESTGDFTIEVHFANSLAKVGGAKVTATGNRRPPGHFTKPVSFSGTTNLSGEVTFNSVPLGKYTIEVSRNWYDPIILGRGSVEVPGKNPVGHFAVPNNSARIKFPNIAPWMSTAMDELGQREISGKKTNPRILQYFKASYYWGKDDSGEENAWCASFVSWVMKQHGFTPPRNAFRAMSWANYGKQLAKPVFGAIGVKKRSKGGHTAFVIGRSRNGDQLYMLGGNQENEVNIRSYPRKEWLNFVVPENYDTKYGSLPIYNKNVAIAGRED